METNSESEVPSIVCDSNRENSFLRKLEKHSVYLAIVGMAAGIGNRAIDVTQEKRMIDESGIVDVQNTPAQAPGNISEGPATAEQYASAKSKFEAIKSLVYALDPNKRLYPDTQQMWLNRSSTSAVITEAHVPKFKKENRFYSLDLKHIACHADQRHTNPAEHCTNRHFTEFPLLSNGTSGSRQQSLTEITFKQINAAGHKVRGGDKIVLAFNGERVELQLFNGSNPSIINHKVSPNTKSYVREFFTLIPRSTDINPFDMESLFDELSTTYLSHDYPYLDTKLSEIKQILEVMLVAKNNRQDSSNQNLKNRF